MILVPFLPLFVLGKGASTSPAAHNCSAGDTPLPHTVPFWVWPWHVFLLVTGQGNSCASYPSKATHHAPVRPGRGRREGGKEARRKEGVHACGCVWKRTDAPPLACSPWLCPALPGRWPVRHRLGLGSSMYLMYRPATSSLP
jgi:hypothetical protein